MTRDINPSYSNEPRILTHPVHVGMNHHRGITSSQTHYSYYSNLSK